MGKVGATGRLVFLCNVTSTSLAVLLGWAINAPLANRDSGVSGGRTPSVPGGLRELFLVVGGPLAVGVVAPHRLFGVCLHPGLVLAEKAASVARRFHSAHALDGA